MSQDSILGQPISGFRGLDIPLNLLSAVGAMRSGQLGQLLAMQGIRRAQEQEAALQLPAQRAAYLQSPEVRQQTITEGPQGPTAQAYGLMGPRVPDDATVQRLQAAGQLDPIEAAQVQRWRDSKLEVGAPGDLPPAVMTNDAVDRAYKLAQVDELQRRAQFMQQFLGGGTLQGPNGMQPRSSSYDATTGHLTINSEVPQVRQVDPGTLRPDGKPYQPGDTGPRGEPIEVKPVKGAGVGAIQIGAQMKRLDAAILQADRLRQPRKLSDGTTQRPIDVLPNFSGDQSALAMIPGASWAARSGILGAIPVPGGTLGDAILSGVANDTETDPRWSLASDVLSARGDIVNIVKAFGDAANIADAEQERTIRAFLPSFGDSPARAEQKLEFLKTSLVNIRTALQSGSITTTGQLRNAMASAFGTPFKARAETDAGYRDDGAPVAFAGDTATPAAPGAATPAPAGTSYSPEQTNADRALLGLPPLP